MMLQLLPDIFLNEMGCTVCESTVKSIKIQYKDELGKQQADTGRSVINSLLETWSIASIG